MKISAININYNLHDCYQISVSIDKFYGWNTRTTDMNISNRDKENLSKKEKE
jgi:hypothetical protein